jgi:type I restriction enzyme S subunit
MVVEKCYKQTEIGVIPEGWNLKLLNDISIITRLAGYEYSTMWKEDPNGEIIALRGFNIGQNRILEKDFVRISDELSKKLKRSRLYKGNVIYPCVGTIGNAVVIDENNKYHIQQNIAKIIPNEDEIFPLYLSYYLMSSFGLSEIQKFNGSSSQPNILVGSLRRYSIIIPQIPEQTAIATALSDMDELIAQTEKLIEKKKAIKQGVMQELLRPKEGWLMKKLGDLVDYIPSGNYGRPSNTPNQILFDVVTTSHIEYDDKWNNKPMHQRCFTKAEIDRYLPRNGDMIIVKASGSAQSIQSGKIGYIDQELCGQFLFSNFLMLIRPKEINPKYLYYYLISHLIKPLLPFLVEASTYPNLKLNEYFNLNIHLPSPDHIDYIVNVFDSLSSEMNAIEKKLVKLKLQKQAMMQALLTGKIRLV